MIVQLQDYTVDAEDKIGRAAAICYDGKTDTESNLRRAMKCKADGHLTTMRFAYATIYVGDISRVCSHQIVRLAHAGLLQESQRYVKQSHVEFIDPPALLDSPDDFQKRWLAVQMEARGLYQEAVDKKYMVKGDARYILPQGCTTSLEMCLNFQAWQHFLDLRLDKAAQWEVRNTAEAVLEILNGIAPNLFPLLQED